MNKKLLTILTSIFFFISIFGFAACNSTTAEGNTDLPNIPETEKSVQVDEEGWKTAFDRIMTANNITIAIKTDGKFDGEEVKSVLFTKFTEDKSHSEIYEVYKNKKLQSQLYWKKSRSKITVACINSDKWEGLISSDVDMNLNRFDGRFLGQCLNELTKMAIARSCGSELSFVDVYGSWYQTIDGVKSEDMFSDFTFNDGVYELSDVNSYGTFTISVKIDSSGLLSYVKAEYNLDYEGLKLEASYEYVFYGLETTEITEPNGATEWYETHLV